MAKRANPDETGYWAFISYNHADVARAKWLQRSLEGYRVPRRLVGRLTNAGRVARRLVPVFRDRADLPASADLRADIRTALQQSGSLIVVCSPAAAVSTWVDAEVREMERLGRRNRVFCLIVDGEPNVAADDRCRAECLPPALRAPAGVEEPLTGATPLGADLRPGGDGRRGSLLKLVAGVLGVGFDELRQRDQRRRRLRVAGWSTVMLALLLVLAGFGVRLRDEQERARRAQYLSQIADAKQKYERNDLHGAAAVLRATDERLRGWEWGFLYSLLDGSTGSMKLPGDLLSLSANGGLVATLVQDTLVSVVDWTAGHEVARFKAGGQVTAAGFSADGQHLVVGRADGQVALYDPKAARLLAEVRTEWPPRALAVAPGGGPVVIVTGQGPPNEFADRYRVERWDIGNSQLRVLVEPPGRGPVLDLSVSGDASVFLLGRNCYCTLAQTDLVVYSMSDGAELFYQTGRGALKGRAGRQIVLGYDHGPAPVELFGLSDSEHKLAELGQHTAGVTAVAVGELATVAVTGASDGLIRTWDLESKEPLTALRGHSTEIAALGFSPDGEEIVSIDAAGNLRRWDRPTAEDGADRAGRTFQEVFAFGIIDSVHFERGDSALIVAAGDRVRAVLGGGSTKLNTGEDEHYATLLRLEARDRAVRTPASLPPGKAAPIELVRLDGAAVALLAVQMPGALVTIGHSDDGALIALQLADTVRLLRSRDGTLTRILTRVNQFALSADARLLAIVPETGQRDSIRVLDVRTGKTLASRKGKSIQSIGFLPGGATLLIGEVSGPDEAMIGETALWYLAQHRRPEVRLRGYYAESALSADGRYLALASGDLLRFWDVRAKRLAGALTVDSVRITSLAFSPDGSRLVLGACDGQWRLVETSGWSVVLTWPAHDYGRCINGIAFNSRGTAFATHEWKNLVHVWVGGKRPSSVHPSSPPGATGT